MILPTNQRPAPPTPTTAMYQNTEHPDHDVHLELLCSIPCEPARVLVSDLCNDFGMARQTELQDLIRGLRSRGFQVSVRNQAHHGRVVSIDKRGRGDAIHFSQQYWNHIYGA